MNLRKIAVILLAVTMTSCTTKQHSDTAGSVLSEVEEPVDSVEEIKRGVHLMYEEGFGGIKAGIHSEEVIAILGEPDIKSEIKYVSEDDSNRQTWIYMDKGCELSFYVFDDSTWQVESYSLNQNSILRSERGIGISNTTEEVRLAYEQELARQQGEEQIIVGTLRGGIVFWLTEGKVSNIFVGSSVE